jgi:hypothetical protein
MNMSLATYTSWASRHSKPETEKNRVEVLSEAKKT